MPAIRKREAVRHAQKTLSYRHTAFHFCEWALGQKKLTTKLVVAYMKENGLTATEWRARALKMDWAEYRAGQVAEKAMALRRREESRQMRMRTALSR